MQKDLLILKEKQMMALYILEIQLSIKYIK